MQCIFTTAIKCWLIWRIAGKISENFIRELDGLGRKPQVPAVPSASGADTENLATVKPLVTL